MGAVSHRIVTIILLLVAAEYVHSECECAKFGDDKCEEFVKCVKNNDACSQQMVARKNVSELYNCDKNKIKAYFCALEMTSLFDKNSERKEELETKYPCLDVDKTIQKKEADKCEVFKKRFPCFQTVLPDIDAQFSQKCGSALDHFDCANGAFHEMMKAAKADDDDEPSSSASSRFSAMFAIFLFFI